jgi:hypothetical protein
MFLIGAVEEAREMTFESHKVVKEYVEELKKITAVREHTQKRLVEQLEIVAATKTNYGINEDYNRANQKVKELELSLSVLTNKGQSYILKIDQLNGVR